jgi:carboxyl-terminal processing protease
MSRLPLLRFLAGTALAASCLVGGYAVGVRAGPPAAQLRPPAPAELSADDQRTFGVIWEALTELKRDYYRPDQLDSEKLAAAAAKGMVDAVGDPYTTLSNPQQSELTAAELRGTFDGIGLQLDRRDGQLQVISTVPGSPAEHGGLQPGDLIATVDGQDVSPLSADDVAARIRGPRETTVTLGLVRGDSPFDVAVVRGPIKVDSVHSRVLPGDAQLAYVRISIFAEPTAQQLRDGLTSLLAQGSRGIVLDLRGNPGGYLTSAVDVTSAFLKDGVVLYQERRDNDGSRRPYRTTGSAQVPDLPIAVLVDHNSASAAEIVAAALRDNQRAVLIGETTFGKGTVQELHKLSDDSQLRVTVAQWLTPAGQAIQGHGLVPDQSVAAVDGDDAPLEAAVQYLLQGLTHG